MVIIFLVLFMSLVSTTFNTVSEGTDVLLEAYDYSLAHKDSSIQTNQPVGVAVIAFNRPQYFKRLLESLEKNAESQTLPFYFFLDGGPRATQQENVKLINQSLIKHKEIILRPRNFGCVKTIIDAHRFMFDWCGYKKIIYLQEDLLVSPYYITASLNLHEWATKNYSNVGIASCYSYCFGKKETKKTRLTWVREPPANYWWSFVTYCLDNKVWDDIKPILYKYEKFIDEIPHTEEFAKARSKPYYWIDAPKIRTWLRSLCAEKIQSDKNSPWLKFRTEPDKQVFPASNVYKAIGDEFSSTEPYHINEDSLTAFSLWLKGYMKIETIVNRVIHIGDEGITVDPKLIQQIGIHHVKLDIFEEDAQLKNFIVK